jgi:hypothetical protein
MTRAATSALVFVFAIGMAALAITRDAWPWIADDAFISLRYSENLLLGHGLVWNPGERVEGYSNLLWVLLSAGLGWFGCDLVTAVRLLALTTTAAMLAVLSFSRLLPEPLPARLVVVTLAAQGSLALWAIGGLEAPLAMLLVALTMHGLERAFAGDAAPRRRWLVFTGVQLALLAWTRPDGPLWSGFAAVAVWWCARGTPRRPLLIALLLPPVGAVLVQLGFRLAYYDDWLPNTGRVKASPFAASLDSGCQYLLSAAVALRSLLVPAGLGALLGWRLPRARPLLLFAIVGLIGWCLYVVRVGGDVFPRNRFLVIAFAPIVVLAGHGVGALHALGRTGRLAACTVLVASIGLARFDAERPALDPRQQLSAWEADATVIGTWLGRAFASEQPLLAVDAAGAVPFFSKLPSLDMLGLCDRTIARTPVAPDRSFAVGHNRGNGPYVLARQPDLILFNVPGSPPMPTWQSGIELFTDPAFFTDHRLVVFETDALARNAGRYEPLRLLPWLRLEGRVGVRRSQSRIEIPGHLLGCFQQTRGPHDQGPGTAWLQQLAVVGVFDAARGRVVGEVRRSGRLQVPQLRVPAGEWSLHGDGLPADVALSLVRSDGQEVPHEGARWHVGEPQDPPVSLDIVCIVPDTVVLPFHVTSIVLQQRD